MKISRNLLLLVVSLSVLLGTAFADRRPAPRQPVRHDTKFGGVPDTKLQIRAIEYDGSTNGSLKVQIKNPTKAPLKFSAQGIYFVPEGDPQTAPQRLGAVGPMQLATDAKEVSELEIAAGATVEVALDVFCIDSHRASPSPANRFNVGTKRLPKEMTATIERKATEAVDASKREGNTAPRPAAKGRIQSDVWQTRDADWVELDGEGAQEAKKKKRK
jgi:hypothetical protein